MQMMDILNQAGGIGAIAKELGVDEATAQSGASALLPAVLGGFKGQAQQSGGLGGLAGMLGGLGGGGLLDSVLGSGRSDVAAGNGVLGQIFGSKDVSRQVADHAAATSGVEPGLLKKMLPLLAMAVAGYMAKQVGGAQGAGIGGMLGNLVGGMMGGGAQPAQQPAPAGAGGLGSLLDMDHDGNPLNDIIGMAGRLTGR